MHWESSLLYFAILIFLNSNFVIFPTFNGKVLQFFNIYCYNTIIIIYEFITTSYIVEQTLLLHLINLLIVALMIV